MSCYKKNEYFRLEIIPDTIAGGKSTKIIFKENSFQNKVDRIGVVDTVYLSERLRQVRTFTNKLSGQERLLLIKELLKYEKDTTTSVMYIVGYNPEYLRLKYSIQVEALFIINQIYCDSFYNYSPYPILKSIKYDSLYNSYNAKSYQELESIDGEIVKEAYSCYKEWFNKIQIMGVDTACKKKIFPLDNCSVKWHRTFTGNIPSIDIIYPPIDTLLKDN